MAECALPALWAAWIGQMAAELHADIRWRLGQMIVGVLFARGRTTVASWLRAAQLRKDYEDYYYFLSSLGRKVDFVAGRVLDVARRRLDPGERILLAIDDTPTKRYGPCVEGAGIHHNPTPGPADQKFVYGHVWVTISWVLRHSSWGTIGLPLLARMYVRRINLPKIPFPRRPAFRTKIEQAVELLEWAAAWLKWLKKPIWVVVDGFYGKTDFLRAAKTLGIVVVGRLRRDAALWSLPVHVPGKRGRKPIYGKDRWSLAKRAGQRRGWQTADFILYGRRETKTFKTFIATYRPAGGEIRVVLVKEAHGWIAFFSTDPQATVAQILEAVADRAAIEQDFHDLKEVHGVGKQQLRNYHSNVAAFNLQCWLHTLIELWCWEQPHSKIVDRSASPWDDPARRPSHADRRNALRRECIHNEIQRRAARQPIPPNIKRLLDSFAKFAA